MAREVAIGKQRFADMREHGDFLVDKTGFIRDWWNARDDITLICRPRRFGKTLMLSTVESFLSPAYAGRGEELFSGLEVWGDPAMRTLQGSVPVVALSFADCKSPTLDGALKLLKLTLSAVVEAHGYLSESSAITNSDRSFLAGISDNMDDVTAATSLKRLCRMLHAHHGVRPVVLLDEYDTPLQEAWLGGYWDGMSAFVRSLFNSTFKTNPSLGRALVTGITRVASESIFSDMNNPRVVTVTTPAYEASFGFTQEEVDAALVEFGLRDKSADVRDWYDGFTFGELRDVYNPWSITCFLNERRLGAYWVNTSSNGLASSLVRRSGKELKSGFETLLNGGSVAVEVDEAVTFNGLYVNDSAAWSLLLAAGYLRVTDRCGAPGKEQLKLELTNREVRAGFDRMVHEWFENGGDGSSSGFVRALLAGDVDDMQAYLADLAFACMSSFDSGIKPSRNLPERFWHGLVLGLLVELRGRYEIRSNPESGYGRCDVVLAPLDGADGSDPAVVIEFKVFDARRGEKSLADTAENALSQVRERGYSAALRERGIGPSRVHVYGIAFKGKEVQVSV